MSYWALNMKHEVHVSVFLLHVDELNRSISGSQSTAVHSAVIHADAASVVATEDDVFRCATFFQERF